jgi:sigma-B regulation protein RsbU (phosphoserine phosphatase)
VDYTVAETHIPAGSRLYLLSDGVYEVQLPSGEEMRFDDFVPLLQTPPPAGPEGLRGIRAAVAALQGRERFDDDFSLVEIIFA